MTLTPSLDGNFPRFGAVLTRKKYAAYLDQLAAELHRLGGAERDLRRQLDDAEGRARQAASTDPEFLTMQLGEEAARVLNAAREAAADRIAGAEASAEATIAAADRHAAEGAA